MGRGTLSSRTPPTPRTPRTLRSLRGSRHAFAALALGVLALGTAASARAEGTQGARKGVGGRDPFIPYPPPPRVLPPPDRSYSYAEVHPSPTLPWVALQLLPSPEVAVGRVTQPSTAAGQVRESTEAALGLRWQVTPVVWSWGTSRHISRWRFVVVDPMARHSGSLELSGTFEYIFGHVDRLVVRPGVRGYFPLVQRGEYLSASFGTSTYAYDDKMRVAYDVGLYALFGLFGVQVTVAPNHDPLTAIGTFRIRYF